MSDKLLKIVEFEQELRKEEESMPATLESVVGDYRTKAHHRIAKMMRDNEEQHEENLKQARHRAEEKGNEIYKSRDKTLESVKKDYRNNKTSAIDIIMEEVMKHGNR